MPSPYFIGYELLFLTLALIVVAICLGSIYAKKPPVERVVVEKRVYIEGDDGLLRTKSIEIGE